MRLLRGNGDGRLHDPLNVTSLVVPSSSRHSLRSTLRSTYHGQVSYTYRHQTVGGGAQYGLLIAFAAMRAFALTARNWPLAVTVFLLGLVPYGINMVLNTLQRRFGTHRR